MRNIYAISWKDKSNIGDTQHLTLIANLSDDNTNHERGLLLVVRTLTPSPELYTNQAKVLRLFRGKALIEYTVLLSERKWMAVQGAIDRLPKPPIHHKKR